MSTLNDDLGTASPELDPDFQELPTRGGGGPGTALAAPLAALGGRDSGTPVVSTAGLRGGPPQDRARANESQAAAESGSAGPRLAAGGAGARPPGTPAPGTAAGDDDARPELFTLTETPDKTARMQVWEEIYQRHRAEGHSRQDAVKEADHDIGAIKLAAFEQAREAETLTPELVAANMDVVAGAIKTLAADVAPRVERSAGTYSADTRELRNALGYLAGLDNQGEFSGEHRSLLVEEGTRALVQTWVKALNAVIAVEPAAEDPQTTDREAIYYDGWRLSQEARSLLGYGPGHMPARIAGIEVRRLIREVCDDITHRFPETTVAEELAAEEEEALAALEEERAALVDEVAPAVEKPQRSPLGRTRYHKLDDPQLARAVIGDVVAASEFVVGMASPNAPARAHATANARRDTRALLHLFPLIEDAAQTATSSQEPSDVPLDNFANRLADNFRYDAGELTEADRQQRSEQVMRQLDGFSAQQLAQLHTRVTGMLVERNSRLADHLVRVQSRDLRITDQERVEEMRAAAMEAMVTSINRFTTAQCSAGETVLSPKHSGTEETTRLHARLGAVWEYDDNENVVQQGEVGLSTLFGRDFSRTLWKQDPAGHPVTVPDSWQRDILELQREVSRYGFTIAQAVANITPTHRYVDADPVIQQAKLDRLVARAQRMLQLAEADTPGAIREPFDEPARPGPSQIFVDTPADATVLAADASDSLVEALEGFAARIAQTRDQDQLVRALRIVATHIDAGVKLNPPQENPAGLPTEYTHEAIRARVNAAGSSDVGAVVVPRILGQLRTELAQDPLVRTLTERREIVEVESETVESDPITRQLYRLSPDEVPISFIRPRLEEMLERAIHGTERPAVGQSRPFDDRLDELIDAARIPATDSDQRVERAERILELLTETLRDPLTPHRTFSRQAGRYVDTQPSYQDLPHRHDEIAVLLDLAEDLVNNPAARISPATREVNKAIALTRASLLAVERRAVAVFDGAGEVKQKLDEERAHQRQAVLDRYAALPDDERDSLPKPHVSPVTNDEVVTKLYDEVRTVWRTTVMANGAAVQRALADWRTERRSSDPEAGRPPSVDDAAELANGVSQDDLERRLAQWSEDAQEFGNRDPRRAVAFVRRGTGLIAEVDKGLRAADFVSYQQYLAALAPLERIAADMLERVLANFGTGTPRHADAVAKLAALCDATTSDRRAATANLTSALARRDYLARLNAEVVSAVGDVVNLELNRRRLRPGRRRPAVPGMPGARVANFAPGARRKASPLPSVGTVSPTAPSTTTTRPKTG